MRKSSEAIPTLLTSSVIHWTGTFQIHIIHPSPSQLRTGNQDATVVVDLSDDEISLPDLSPRPVSRAERTENVNTWVQDTLDPIPVPILPPSNDLAPQDETMAATDVSGFTQLTNCSQDTRTWLEDTVSILPHIQGKLLSLEQYDPGMTR